MSFLITSKPSYKFALGVKATLAEMILNQQTIETYVTNAREGICYVN